MNLALIGKVVSEIKIVKIMVIYMYMYMTGQGQTTLGVIFFQKCKFSVNLAICCKLIPFHYFETVFFFYSNAQSIIFDLP